eukprot:s668_g25.t1
MRDMAQGSVGVGMEKRSEVSGASTHLGSDQELMSSLLPVRQRIRRGFKQIERIRRKAPVLLVVDDEVGAFTSSAAVRKLFGELLEHTCHLHLLVLSRTPIYSSLGPSKVVNVALPGLEEYDAAKLFLQRMHRKLEARDFPAPMGSADAGGGEWNSAGSFAIAFPGSAGSSNPEVERSSPSPSSSRPPWQHSRGCLPCGPWRAQPDRFGAAGG